MESTVSFGQWVRARRTSLRLTQGELARQVYCSEITIRKIEGDERRPSAEIARGLATHLQLPDDLLARFLKVARGELSADHLPLLHNQNERPRHWLPLLSRADLAIPETSFLGRTQEVAQVCELLQQPDLRLLTLVGPPGIGKSRLSLHVAAELSDAFLNGAHLVPLAPLRDAELVPDAIAQIFGFAESAYPTPLDYLRVELRARHLLLILDNFEQVLPARRCVEELLAVAPSLKILVTSRVPLSLADERTFLVAPLPLPAPTQTPTTLAAIRYPAVQLLVSRARAANPAFILTAENTGEVAAICARMDGLPLAIELVAARLTALTPEALLARLSDWLALPVDPSNALPERHRTLRNAIAWSYDLLPVAAQRVFARLAVFVHGAGAEMAQALCGAAGDTEGSAQEQIDLLVNHNLVRAEVDGAGRTRYTMLETVLDFARAQLLARNEWSATRQTHARLFCAFSEAAAPALLGRERRAWIERVEEENDNLRAALRWASESGDAATLARLVAALGWFWEMQGRRSEARVWLAAALAAPQPPSQARARLLHMFGHIAGEEGDIERSRRYALESLALAESLGDGWTVALAQRDLDWVLFVGDNDPEQAIALADAAATALLAAGDLRNYLLTLLDAAMICQKTGQAQRGTPYARTALRLAQEWEDEQSACEARSTLGLLAYTDGDYARALPLLEENLALAARLPNGKLVAWANYWFGQVLLDSGDTVRAADHFGESARLWRERNETLAVTYCQSGLANCLFQQGATRQARTVYRATLSVYRQFAARRAEAWTLWNLAHTAVVEGHSDRIEPLLRASETCFRQRNEAAGIVCCAAARRGEWCPAREPVRQ